MSSLHASGARPRMSLACKLCSQRKVKCDRLLPCSNCVRCNESCVPSMPAPPRQRRRPNNDLRERLARCEELLRQYSGAVPPAAPGPAAQESPLSWSDEVMAVPTAPGYMSSPPSPHGSPAPLGHGGRIVQDEDGTRLADGYIWASLYDELHAMRDLVAADDRSDGQETTPKQHDSSYDSCTDILSGDDKTVCLDDLQPSPAHAFRLWQLFLDRVNPLTKIIHAPTVQHMLTEGITSIGVLPIQQQALLFSIYTMAVTSLTEDECVAMLETPRASALRQFTLGAKLSLIRFNFLINYDMAILQAMSLFLHSLPSRYNRYATWIVSGMLVRAAQKMGYHRDGAGLGLTPFETEMRRRIWWQVVTQDLTLSMVSGLAPSLQPSSWDTQEPSNLNDADLLPDAVKPPSLREGPTEMGFCILMYRIQRFAATEGQTFGGTRTLEAAIMGKSADGGNDAREIQETMNKYRDAAARFDTAVQELKAKYLDANAGNSHKVALDVHRIAIADMENRMMPMQQQPEWGSEIFTQQDNLFKLLLVCHEQGSQLWEAMAEYHFEWVMAPHFHRDMFAALVSQLYRRPAGQLSDRAWRIVSIAYEQHPKLLNMELQPQHVQLAQYIVKGWDAREAFAAQAERTMQPPPVVERLREKLALLGAPSPAWAASNGVEMTAPQEEMMGFPGVMETLGPFSSSTGGLAEVDQGCEAGFSQADFARYISLDVGEGINQAQEGNAQWK